MLNYPLTMSFKIVAINPQVTVTDTSGQVVAYVKQKAFRLKEDGRSSPTRRSRARSTG